MSLIIAPIKSTNFSPIDTAFAAGQGAIIEIFRSGLARSGAIIGATTKLAYRVNELWLNFAFGFTSSLSGGHLDLLLAFLRTGGEIYAAAALTQAVLPLLWSAAPVTFSTYLLFSALENIRFIRSGSFSAASGASEIMQRQLLSNDGA